MSQPGTGSLRHHDGTSQAQRHVPALNPAYVSVDERSIESLIRFAQQYSEKLLFIDARDQSRGNWAAFLEGDPEEMAAFLRDPSHFDYDPEKKARYSRPHLVLFLTFLDLLQPVRARMNEFTGRHLEFFYERALRLTRKAAVPDQVHVFAELLPQSDDVLLPAGTLLPAGEDSAGQLQLYKTEESLLANRGKLSQAISLYVKKEQTGLAQLQARWRAEPDGGFMEMLKLVYGEAGLDTSALPPFRDVQAPDGKRQVDYPLIQSLDDVMAYITNTLHMQLSAFRRIVKLYLSWYEPNGWDTINEALAAAFQKRTGNPGSTLNIADPRDFDENFSAAIGFHPTAEPGRFDGLAEVDSLYDLFRVLERLRGEASQQEDKNKEARITQLENFITGDARDENGAAKGLFFPSLQAFTGMMQKRASGLRNLREILDILRSIVRAEPMLSFRASIDEFAYFKGKHLLEEYLNNLQLTSGNSGGRPVTPPEISPFHPHSRSWTEDYNALLEEIPHYFHMPTADYHFIRKVFQAEHAPVAPGEESPPPQPDWKWEKIYRLFTQAYRGDTPPGPVDIKWKNLFLARDASSVSIPPQTESGLPRWKPFGEEGPARGRIGFAIASPMLELREGRRYFLLTLGFAESGFLEKLSLLRDELEGNSEAGAYPLNFFVSTAEEMIPLKVLRSAVSETGAADFTLPANGEAVFENIPFRYDYPCALQFVLEVDPEAPPLAPLEGEAAISRWPVLSVQLADLPAADREGRYEKRYSLLSGLQLAHVHLAAYVTEIDTLELQHDEGQPDAQKPFEAFGIDPRPGNSLYIAHPGLARQRLDELKLQLEWMNLPDMGLGAYYQAYRQLAPEANFSIPINNNADFKVQLSVRDGRHEHTLAAARLFPNKGSQRNDIEYAFAPDAYGPEYPYRPKAEATTEGEVLEGERYFRLEFTGPGFQQDKYPTLVDRQSHFAVNGKFFAEGSEEAISRVAGTNAYLLQQQPVPGLTKDNFIISTPQAGKTIQVEAYDEKNRQLTLSGTATSARLNYRHNPYQGLILYPPFIPVLKSISAAYKTHIELALDTARPQQENQLLHLTVAGHNPMELAENQPDDRQASEAGQAKEKGFFLLPRYDNEGELYLGISGLQPPQTLSLLFQIAEGSNNPRLEAARVSWHYLCGTRWKSLEEGQLRSDTTRGLLTSGILQFAVPEDASLRHTLLPAGLHWIRASVQKDTASVADIIAIHTQAVRAAFVDQDNAPDHYLQALPPESIENVLDPVSGLAAIRQPYPSFRGKPAEQDAAFYTRVSERLRHKQRALTAWDYERLVLEQFPEVHRARALHAGYQEDPNEIGVVELVLLPNIRGKQLYDPFEPRAAQGLLQEVKTFLQKYIPPYVEVRVKNPDFYYLVVKVDVRFHDSSNPGYYLGRLNRELREFLSPWFYDSSAEIVFGGEVYESVIVNFLENRPYVDFVEYPALIIQKRDANREPETLGEPYISIMESGHIRIRRPDVVLASAPQHRIGLIPDEDDSDIRKRGGIGDLEIELDFKIET